MIVILFMFLFLLLLFLFFVFFLLFLVSFLVLVLAPVFALASALVIFIVLAPLQVPVVVLTPGGGLGSCPCSTIGFVDIVHVVVLSSVKLLFSVFLFLEHLVVFSRRHHRCDGGRATYTPLLSATRGHSDKCSSFCFVTYMRTAVGLLFSALLS